MWSLDSARCHSHLYLQLQPRSHLCDHPKLPNEHMTASWLWELPLIPYITAHENSGTFCSWCWQLVQDWQVNVGRTSVWTISPPPLSSSSSPPPLLFWTVLMMMHGQTKLTQSLGQCSTWMLTLLLPHTVKRAHNLRAVAARACPPSVTSPLTHSPPTSCMGVPASVTGQYQQLHISCILRNWSLEPTSGKRRVYGWGRRVRVRCLVVNSTLTCRIGRWSILPSLIIRDSSETQMYHIYY